MDDIVIDSKYGFNYFKINDPGDLLEIKQYEAELEKSRTEDMKSIKKSVNEVRSDIETLKCEVSKKTKMENLDYLRKIMFDVEEKITHLKEVIKEELLKLIKSEVSLSRDIQFMEKRMEDWNKPLDRQLLKPVGQTTNKVKKINNDNPVNQFQKFLSQTGGHYGGWEEQDHLLFLKERTKYKKKEKFFSALHYLLPDLSYEMIEEHEEWYKKYKTLRDSQKQAIQKWRAEKETQQKIGKENNEETGEEKTQIKKKVHKRINITERIKEWKKQQQLKKLEEKERQEKEKKKLKEEEKRKRELQEMKKLAVAQYKAGKLNRVREILPVNNQVFPTDDKKVKNKILLKAFRLQDLKFMEKKKVIRLQIESASSQKLKLAKPALEFLLQRDPQRIFQPTEIWSQHCLESQKREKINPVFDLNSIPRLAIPEWRRELK